MGITVYQATKAGVYSPRRSFSLPVSDCADAANLADKLIDSLETFKTEVANLKLTARYLSGVASEARKLAAEKAAEKAERDAQRAENKRQREERKAQREADKAAKAQQAAIAKALEKQRAALAKDGKAGTKTTTNRHRVNPQVAAPVEPAETPAPTIRRARQQAPAIDRTPAAPVIPPRPTGRTRPRILA
jgi:ribonuclease E